MPAEATEVEGVMRSGASLLGLGSGLLVKLRRPRVAVRMPLGFGLGAIVVWAALPVLASAGIDFQTCPLGLQSYLTRVAAVWLLATVAVGFPVWLLALDPLPLTGVWLVLAVLWKYGAFLSGLIPR
jgi:hypothetical protein